ncbi:MAG: 2,3-bisphosphoglycerate-dependent phosphoglycerate mutase [Ilumatobacteraceae bacterium]|jgi:broad specificity phosphatase PhoE
MDIVLIRHGEPEWVRDGLNVVDPPLTERGLRQAERVATALTGEVFDEIVISPLLRPRLTAEPTLRQRSADEVIESWLEEIREPNWHGTPSELSRKAYEEERSRPASARWEGLVGGEPSRDFVERVRAGATNFLAERGIYRSKQTLPVWHMDESERRIAVFAHAGTNGVVLCHLLGLDPVPWEWDRFVTAHASITRLVTMKMGDGHTFSLVKLSDVEHLDHEDRTG